MADQDFDPWSRDEWWRTQNPGLSMARGVLIGGLISLALWGVIVIVVVGVWALVGYCL